MAYTPSPIVYVTYDGTPVNRFDRRYYVEQHLPLVMQQWQRYGLIEVTAFFPSETHVGTRAMCECRFRDDAAIAAAFASPEAVAVMADVAKFTDMAPMRSRAVSL